MESPITFVPAIFGGGSSIHWIILLVIALLLFGRRLPSILRGLGGSIREFKKGVEEGDNAHSAQRPDSAVNRQATSVPKVSASQASIDERIQTVAGVTRPTNSQ